MEIFPTAKYLDFRWEKYRPDTAEAGAIANDSVNRMPAESDAGDRLARSAPSTGLAAGRLVDRSAAAE